MTTMTELEEAQDAGRLARELEGFRAVYEKTDRIMSNRDVRVKIVFNPNLPYPAWTDGETIWLNGEMLRAALATGDFTDIVRMTKCLNLHELCHVLYTPRQGSDLMKWVMENQYGYGWQRYAKQSWNILEDQRIEMMFTARYRPAGPYFESMVLQWLLAREEQYDNAHMLVYGRKYLPEHVTAPLNARFRAAHGDAIADEAEAIIDQYNRLVFPTGNWKAKSLIQQFSELTLKMMQAKEDQNDAGAPPAPRPEAMVGDDVGIDQGGQPDRKAQQDAQKQMDDVKPRVPQKTETTEEEQTNDQAEGEADGEAEGDADAGDQSGGLEEAEGDEGAGGSAPVEGDAPEQQDDLSAGDDGGGKGAAAPGDGANNAPDDVDLDNIFGKALDDLMEDEKFKADVDRVAKAVRDAIDDGEVVAEGADGQHEMHRTPAEIKVAAHTMEEHLRQMRVQLEETHVHNVMHGQIDPARYLARQPWDVDFFRAYDPGAIEDTDVEAVILIDQSGSMKYQMAAVSAALWATKRALEQLDARVTVLGFADQHYMLYSPEDKLDRNEMRVFGVRGGTYPQSALVEAYKVFSQSKRKIKLLISLTDGEWFGDKDKLKGIVRAIAGQDVTTQMMYMGQGSGMANGHDILTKISDPGDLAKAAVQLVNQAMSKNVHEEG